MPLIKYFFIGGASAFVDIGLFIYFADYLGWPWGPVAVGTFVLATLVNYFLSINYVFESGVRYQKKIEIGAVFAVSFFGLIVNQLVLYLGIVWMDSSLIIAKICATAIGFFWNFFSRKHFIF